MLKWHCEIPGPKESPWEGGSYILTMDFTHDYPVRYLYLNEDLQNVFLSQCFLTQIYILLERYAFQF